MAILTRSQNWVHPQTFDDIEQANEWARLHYIEHQNESSARKLDFLPRTYKVVNHRRVGSASWKIGVAGPTAGFWSVFPTLNFDNAADDEAHYVLMVPYTWDGTTNISFLVDWAHEVASVAGVTWALEYVSIKAGEAVGGATTTLVEPSGATVINVMQRTTFDPGITATDLEAGDSIGLRLYRDVSDAGDTLAGDARLINTHFHVTTDKLGKEP